MLAAYHLNQIEIDEEQLKTISKQLQILKFDGKLSCQNQLNIIKSANITLINLLNKYKQLITSKRECRQNKQKRRQQIKKSYENYENKIHNLNTQITQLKQALKYSQYQLDKLKAQFKLVFIQYDKACEECFSIQHDQQYNQLYDKCKHKFSFLQNQHQYYSSKCNYQQILKEQQKQSRDQIVQKQSTLNTSDLDPTKQRQQDRLKRLAKENQQHSRKNHWRQNRFKFFSKFLGIHESNPNQVNDGKEEQNMNKTPNQMNKFFQFCLKEFMTKRSLRKNECNECGWFEHIDDPQAVSKTSKKDGKSSIPHNIFSGPKRTSSLPSKRKQEQ